MKISIGVLLGVLLCCGVAAALLGLNGCGPKSDLSRPDELASGRLIYETTNNRVVAVCDGTNLLYVLSGPERGGLAVVPGGCQR